MSETFEAMIFPCQSSPLVHAVSAGGLALLLSLSSGSARPEQARGATLYQRECAACHGTAMEGQPRWWQVDSTGRLPAPPLDQTGHAWQHSDAQLADMIANSMRNVAGPDYASAMPAFAGRLTSADIEAIIQYIRAQWPIGVQASQALLNPGGEAMLLDLLSRGDDWTFAPDCIGPVGRAAASARSVGR